MGIDHVQMALVDRQVDGLADRAAGMVQPGRGIGEFHEIAEILDRGIAPPALQVGDEGRTVRGQQNNMIAPQHDRRGRVTTFHAEALGRRRAQRPGQTGIEAHPRARDRGPNILEKPQRLLIAAELDADFPQNPLGMGLQTR
jgi:hypothetical protein